MEDLDSAKEAYSGRVRDNSYNFSANFTPPMTPTAYNDGYESRSMQRRHESTRHHNEREYEHSLPRENRRRDDSHSKYERNDRNDRYREADYNQRNRRYDQSPQFERRKYYSETNQFDEKRRLNDSPRVERRNRSDDRDRHESYMANMGRSQSFHVGQKEEPTYANSKDDRKWTNRATSPELSVPPRPAKKNSFSFNTLQNAKKKFSNWSKKKDDTEQYDSKSNLMKSEKKISPKKNKSNENTYSSQAKDYSKDGSTLFSVKISNKLRRSSPNKNLSQSQSFKEERTYDREDEAPVPPPRTKRRPKPQTSYFFGDPSSSSSTRKERPISVYADMSYGKDQTVSQKLRRERDYTTQNNDTYLSRSASNITHNRSHNNYDSDRHDKRSNRYEDEEEGMNRRNERHNLEYSQRSKYNDGNTYVNGRDSSNDRYDSGYGGRREKESRRHEKYRSSPDEWYHNRRTDENRGSSRRGSREDKRINERDEVKYRSTKDIPVIVERKQPKHYKSMNEINSYKNKSNGYSQTLESRKKASDEYLRNTSTLPKKVLQHNNSTPSKPAYDRSENVYSQKTAGSMMNITSPNGYATYKPQSHNESVSKHVSRSHSLNHRSSPNLSNLRSPNLIASIARTNSTRYLDEQNDEDYTGSQNMYKGNYDNTHNEPPPEDKKEQFMTGLRNTAPELFQFIHGTEDTVDSRVRDDSPPRLIRPSDSPQEPIKTPTVYTFGKGPNGTLRRDINDSTTNLNTLNNSVTNLNTLKNNSTTNLNTINNGTANLNTSMSRHSSGCDSGTFSTNSVKRANSNVQDGGRRQSTFNMKTQGSSLLYSPSFRERAQQNQHKKDQLMRDAQMAGKKERERRERQDQQYWD